MATFVQFSASSSEFPLGTLFDRVPDVAVELDITRQSLAGRVRRAHRNLLAGLFDFDERTLERATSLARE